MRRRRRWRTQPRTLQAKRFEATCATTATVVGDERRVVNADVSRSTSRQRAVTWNVGRQLSGESSHS